MSKQKIRNSFSFALILSLLCLALFSCEAVEKEPENPYAIQPTVKGEFAVTEDRVIDVTNPDFLVDNSEAHIYVYFGSDENYYYFEGSADTDADVADRYLYRLSKSGENKLERMAKIGHSAYGSEETAAGFYQGKVYLITSGGILSVDAEQKVMTHETVIEANGDMLYPFGVTRTSLLFEKRVGKKTSLCLFHMDSESVEVIVEKDGGFSETDAYNGTGFLAAGGFSDDGFYYALSEYENEESFSTDREAEVYYYNAAEKKSYFCMKSETGYRFLSGSREILLGSDFSAEAPLSEPHFLIERSEKENVRKTIPRTGRYFGFITKAYANGKKLYCDCLGQLLFVDYEANRAVSFRFADDSDFPRVYWQDGESGNGIYITGEAIGFFRVEGNENQ